IIIYFLEAERSIILTLNVRDVQEPLTGRSRPVGFLAKARMPERIEAAIREPRGRRVGPVPWPWRGKEEGSFPRHATQGK
ncbi:MAG: hypothetical protein KGL59_14555, partial [Acidobacteriota bacterium]|nr:hypothetical protein [Acidobacteriota bacterium]